MKIKNHIKKSIIRKGKVTITNGSIAIDVVSSASIKYIDVNGKRYNCKNNSAVIPFEAKALRSILNNNITFGVQLWKKRIRLRAPERLFSFEGEKALYNNQQYTVSDESGVDIIQADISNDTMILEIDAYSVNGRAVNGVQALVCSKDGNIVNSFESINSIVRIKGVNAFVDNSYVQILFVDNEKILPVTGENKEFINFGVRYSEGKLIVEKSQKYEYVFNNQNTLSSFPPLFEKYLGIKNVEFNYHDKKLLVYPKEKYAADSISVYLISMKNGEKSCVYDAIVGNLVTIDVTEVINRDIDKIERYLIGYEIYRGKKIIDKNYLKITKAKRRLPEDSILVSDGKNCITYYNKHYLIVENIENYHTFDKKLDVDFRNASFISDFDILNFSNYLCNINLRVHSLIAKISEIIIYARDNYTNTSILLGSVKLNEYANSFDNEIIINLAPHIDYFYNNMRINLRIGVIYENGYRETDLLKKAKNAYSTEERYLESFSDGDRLIALYLAPNEFNANIWCTTNAEYDKSIRFQSCKDVYDSTLRSESVDKDLVFFEANLGKDYTGNPKYLYQYMISHDEYSHFKYVWAYPSEKKNIIPGPAITVERGSKEYFYYLAKAKYWINNILFPVKDKRHDVVYLNTWHGTPLKKLGFDIEVEGPEKQSFDNLYKESQNWDYLLVDNDYGEEKLVGAFRFKKKVIKKGYPINDIFFEKQYKENVKRRIIEEYPVICGKKVILYAPTWRDLQGDYVNGYSFSLPFDITKLYEDLHEECVIIVKLHHLIADNLVIEEKYREFIINASKEEDIMELLCLTDILITDYSSVFYDFASARKPILFYMYDLEEYLNQTRGLYVEIDTLPGPIDRTTEELTAHIKEILEGSYSYYEKLTNFCDEMAKYCNGTSCKDVLDIVIHREEKDD